MRHSAIKNMWNGKNKAVTFSFDDGVTQDGRLAELLKAYGLKATFNLNSSLLGLKGKLEVCGKTVNHTKVRASEVKRIYDGNEVAVHTLVHPLLTREDDETVIRQVEEDRKALESLVGYKVVCMAYPCGGSNNDERVASLIKEHTQIEFARTITSSYGFCLRQNLYRFNPSLSFTETEKLFEMGERFIRLDADRPQLFYIWGHSYELDSGLLSWELFEDFCKLISNKADVFYGTNRECVLNKTF